MIRALLTLFLAASPTLFAAPVPKELRKAFEIEGTWEMVAISPYGRDLKFKRGLHWSFDAQGHMTSSAGPGTPVSKSSLQFTFHREDKTAEYRSQAGERVCPGLFKMEGDTLIICCNLKANGERPKTIAVGPDHYVWTMKRAKEKK